MNYKYFALGSLLLASSISANAWDLKSILNKAGETLSGQQTTTTEQTTETQQNTGFSLGNLLGGNSDNSLTNTLSGLANIADGIFSNDNLTVEDIAGTWTVKGSAVSFKSENFLQQAGGAAAATVVENKLDPYYQKYGLTGATLTIDKEGNFTLKTNKFSLNGTVTVQNDAADNTQNGNFYFHFNTFGSQTLGSVNTYVTKGISGLEIMFDASKLRSLLSAIASVTKMQLAQTATNLLNQYDGICIGFDLVSSTSK